MQPIAENYQLKWHSFTSHLHSCVAASLNSESFADVSLFTVDGHRVQAHRFVLSACSQYLHQVLKFHHKTNTTLPIIIVLPPEINHKTLRTLIQYMYSGETTVSKDILESVLRGGDILKIRGLWRPKEDDPNKKLVKLLQQPQQIAQKPTTTAVQPQIIIQQPQIVIQPPQPQTQPIVPVVEAVKQVIAADKMLDATTPKVLDEPQESSPGPLLPALDETTKTSEELPFLMIKEEPLEWSDVVESEMELLDEHQFHTEMTIKPEVMLESEATASPEEGLYTPLTCELCSETFTIPADWVKHIQTHTDMLPAKRQRRGRTSAEDDSNATFPPLQCDLCQKFFPNPAEWVHHVQNTHTEQELHQSNHRGESPTCSGRVDNKSTKQHHSSGSNLSSLKVCSVCNKKFPSNASMLIHKRTHTGEQPYACKYCKKEFNVKSNLLRHLRTLHDKLVNPTEVNNPSGGAVEEEMVVKTEGE